MVIHTLAHNSVFSFTEVIGFNPKFMGAVALLAFFMIPSMDPAIFQHIAMGHEDTQLAYPIMSIPEYVK